MSNPVPTMMPGVYRFSDGREHYWDGAGWVAQAAQPAAPVQAVQQHAPRPPQHQPSQNHQHTHATTSPGYQAGTSAAAGASSSIPHNPKLTTLAVIASVFGLLGLIVFLVGQAQEDPMMVVGLSYVGGALLGGGFSVWITWLAIGAVIDAIRGRTLDT